SPPNTRIRSACCLSRRTSGLTDTFSPARSAVALSLETLRPASAINAAAFCTTARQLTFSELAMRPTRLILSAEFFKQGQKFLVAGGSEQRRFGYAAPAQRREAADELLQLAQHPLVNLRIGDDAGAFVGLGFAGFKLRFDQDDHPAAVPQQPGRRRQNLAQRNE